MADNEDLRAAQTPMRDLLANVASELESGWRAHSDAPDHMASHQWGDDVSRAVGRIIREALSRDDQNEVLKVGTEELLPCPFCGYVTPREDAIAGVDRDEFNEPIDVVTEYRAVGCAGCGAFLPINVASEADAIAAWNKREALSRDTESGWRVKPIEWQPNGQNTESLYSGELIFNTYYVIDKAGPIWRAERDQFLSERGKDEVASGADLEAVKAMVQRDYENLIAPALLPTPPEAKTP